MTNIEGGVVRRGEIRDFNALDQPVLVTGEDFECDGFRQVRITPIRVGESDLHSNREVRIPWRDPSGTERDAYLEFWNARQVPVDSLSPARGEILPEVVGQVLAYLRAEIFGEVPSLEDGVIGSPVTGPTDPRYDYQLSQAMAWEKAARDGSGLFPQKLRALRSQCHISFDFHRVPQIAAWRSIWARQSVTSRDMWEQTVLISKTVMFVTPAGSQELGAAFELTGQGDARVEVVETYQANAPLRAMVA